MSHPARTTLPTCLPQPAGWHLTALALALAAGLASPGATRAQVAGSAAASVTLTERHAVAMGWSARRSVLGKTVYTDTGRKIGQVQDIIIAPAAWCRT